MVSARGRTVQVAYARKRGMSKSKACKLFRVAPSTTTYQSRMDAKDAPLIDKMAALAQQNHAGATGACGCFWAAKDTR